MKRLYRIIIIFLAVCLCLCGCGKSGTFNSKETIPADGIVEKAVFDKIKGKDVISIFTDSDGKYEWTFLGSKIEETFDTNLSLEIFDEYNGVSKEIFGQYKVVIVPNVENYPGLPSLKISLNKFTYGNAYLYNLVNGAPVYKKSVNVVDSYCVFTLDTLNSGVIIISNIKPDDLTEPPDENIREPDKDPIDNAINPIVTIAIYCHEAVKNWDKLSKEAQNEKIVPKNGIILQTTEVYIKKGDSVYDVLASATKNKIQMESVSTPLYNAVYVNGINNLYEFDCGALSGWTYSVNSWYPNYGSSRYKLMHGDIIEWNYSCDISSIRW